LPLPLKSRISVRFAGNSRTKLYRLPVRAEGGVMSLPLRDFEPVILAGENSRVVAADPKLPVRYDSRLRRGGLNHGLAAGLMRRVAVVLGFAGAIRNGRVPSAAFVHPRAFVS
jgi:hypothetical protein